MERDSNLELYRIIVMLFIVAHHYVVNSGLMPLMLGDSLSVNSIFLFTFGMWGKTGINCFVLITGYFMCKSSTSVSKFLKLLIEVELYNIFFFTLFWITGYETFSYKLFMKAINPIPSVADGFVSCFLLFYLLIPFLNILIKALSRQMHFKLIGLLLFIYTGLGTIPFIRMYINYVSWFCVLYLISSYIRLYGLRYRYNGQELSWGKLSILFIALSIVSVWGLVFFQQIWNRPLPIFHFVADSHHALAVITSVCLFMYFKDLKVKRNKFINTVAASSLGVLLIHANSDTMRRWL